MVSHAIDSIPRMLSYIHIYITISLYMHGLQVEGTAGQVAGLTPRQWQWPLISLSGTLSGAAWSRSEATLWPWRMLPREVAARLNRFHREMECGQLAEAPLMCVIACAGSPAASAASAASRRRPSFLLLHRRWRSVGGAWQARL